MAMKMGSRGGGAAGASRPRAAGVRPVYEDFKPITEWKYEEGADILHIHLPGFLKQQLRIIAETARRVLRVRGERLVAGNKWIRFQEEVHVPEHCNLSGVHAKFEGGILRITMPKNPIPQSEVQPTKAKSSIDQNSTPSSEEDLRKEETSGNNAPAVVEKAKDTKEKLKGMLLPQKSRKEQEEFSETKVKETKEKLNPIRDEKDLGEKVKEAKEKIKDFIGTQRVGKVQEEVLSEEQLSTIEKGKQTMVGESLNDPTQAKVIDDDEGKGESRSSIKQLGKMVEENRAREGEEVGSKEGLISDEVKRIYSGMNLRSLNEERQLLVNAGVAVLVIMALGAYVSYSFGSSRSSRS